MPTRVWPTTGGALDKRHQAFGPFPNGYLGVSWHLRTLVPKPGNLPV